MGVMKKTCSVDPTANAPDPSNYHILGAETVNGYMLLTVYYPGCTNFSGHKLLMFNKNIKTHDFGLRIDPHFDKGDLSPIARFKPTKEGLEMARKLAGAL